MHSEQQTELDGSIVPVTLEHLPEIMEIEAQAHLFPWSEKIFEDCINANYSSWVYLHQQQVIGYSITTMAAGEGHILNICVDPAYQGQGFGKLLLENIFNTAIANEIKVVFLEVRPSNLVAITMYEKHGFHEVGRREKYYPAKRGREDALIMARVLFKDDV